MKTVKKNPINTLPDLVQGKIQKLIMNFLILNPTTEYSANQISMSLEIGPLVVAQTLKKFIDKGLLVRRKSFIGPFIFKLNIDERVRYVK